MQQKVIKIASSMTSIYQSRCSLTNQQCLTKSYNQCVGTAQYECITEYNNPYPYCKQPGASVSKNSGIRIPKNVNIQNLTSQQKIFICASTALDSTFKEIQTGSRNQMERCYIGTSFGFFRGYPGTKQNSINGVCNLDYDTRVRPWYVSAASGAKNVIIVIDISGSMLNQITNITTKTRLQLAKNSAIIVIKTLSLSDFVGVIIFSDNASILMYQSIKRATTLVKDNLISNIQNLGAYGQTNYQSAFDKVQSIFKQASTDIYGPPCKNTSNIVLFLTDGAPTKGLSTYQELKNKIDTWNTAYNIKLFTYGLGTGINTTLLKSLSCNYHGIMYEISDANSQTQLLEKMSSYYMYISDGVRLTSPVWSEPYYDFNTGLRMVTVSMPIYYRQSSATSTSTLFGVAAIDVSMSQLSTYGITQQSAVITLIKNTPCLVSNLTQCDIQYLRNSNKCSTLNCQLPSSVYTCSSSLEPGDDIFASFSVKKQRKECCDIVGCVSGCQSGNIGAIVGGVVGGVFGIILVIIVIYCLRKRYSNKSGDKYKKQDTNKKQNTINTNQGILHPGLNSQSNLPMNRKQSFESLSSKNNKLLEADQHHGVINPYTLTQAHYDNNTVHKYIQPNGLAQLYKK